MKIYCSNNSNELDKFVGKDIWVKVYDKYSECFKYIRIVSSNITSYSYNQLFASSLENPYGDVMFTGGGNRLLGYFTNNVYQDYKSTLEIVYPVTCYTTAEIFPEED